MAVWLFPVRSPLLGEYFLFLQVLRCFSSLGALPPTYVFSRRMLRVRRNEFPHSDIPGSKPVHGSRGLSQCSTSFIGTWRQGIHRKPLVASPRDAENLLLFSSTNISLDI